ncbi:MAG: hypothetical protein KAG56_03735 [Sulfurovaceae bacterium]|nr:hypothetical protein [Sulfurovaceae bacterium]
MKKTILLPLALSLTLSTFAQAETLADFIKTEDKNHSHVGHSSHDNNHTKVIKPYYQGEVVTVEHGGGYTYLEVKEKTEKTFWVAVENSDVKVKDFVRFQKELVSKNFKSKALKRTFEELMFASGLEYRVSKE